MRQVDGAVRRRAGVRRRRTHARRVHVLLVVDVCVRGAVRLRQRVRVRVLRRRALRAPVPRMRQVRVRRLVGRAVVLGLGRRHRLVGRRAPAVVRLGRGVRPRAVFSMIISWYVW